MDTHSLSVGFTGTRQEPTTDQRLSLIRLLTELQPVQLHHGDCIGADSLAHDIVSRHMPDCLIVVHPPIKDDLRAMRVGYITKYPLSYFARNREIVKACDVLIAMPSYREYPLSEATGGTYYTMNYAKKVGKPVHIIWPSGEIESSDQMHPSAGK